jgi:hypothetical protein
MSSKEQLISEIEARAGQFKDLVSGLDEEEFEAKRIEGRWGYRELVSHLTGWQGQLAAGMKQATGTASAAVEPAPGAMLSWNDAFADHARGKRREQVLQEFDAGIATLVAACRDAPEDLFAAGCIGERIAREDLERFDQHIGLAQEARVNGGQEL